jgi:hypothetical protein
VYLSLVPFPLCTFSILIPAYITRKAAVEKSFRSPLSIARAVFVRKLCRLMRLVHKLVVLVYRLVRRLVVPILTFPRRPIKACNLGCPCLFFSILLTFIYFSMFLSFYMPICLFIFLSNICFILLSF